jgi:CheY-specific phosphatase CheX
MEQALYQAVISTFEELAFVFPSEEADLRPIVPGESSTVAVAFHGEFDGELVLTIENTALSVIAENMLGEDHAVNAEMIQDVLGELANVICGNVLPAIAGTQHVFKLSAPAHHDGRDNDRNPSATAHLGMDEGRADVSIYIN